MKRIGPVGFDAAGGLFSPNSSLFLLSLKHPHRLSLYDVSPTEEISLEELEQLALSRLRLLRSIETMAVRQVKEEEFSQRLRVLEDKYMPLHSNEAHKGYSLDEERRRDQLSHHILRLGFCQKEDTRRWFLAQEVALFKYRYQQERSEERLKLLQLAVPHAIPVEEAEKHALHEDLVAASGSLAWQEGVYFKVPWEQVTDLIASRSVLIVQGWAYVPRSDSASMILHCFRARLERALEMMARGLPRLHDEEEGRLLPLLLHICDGMEQDDGASRHAHGVPVLAASDIDKYSGHFPPCMQHLHAKLKEESHLKHGGRMQYGLYLKAIGLSLEEAIVFWKRAFSRKVTEDKFSKEYLYNIRHNYGQEGKRADYAPYNCHKIITSSPPSTGDHHGCPFKHFGEDRLRALLSHLRLPGARLGEKAITNSAYIDEIMNLVKDHHYQIACTRLFEITRKIAANSPGGLVLESAILHPHQFFEWSIQHANAAGPGAV